LDDPWADSGPGDRLPASRRHSDSGRPSEIGRRDDQHDRGRDSDAWEGGGSSFERVPPQDLEAEQSVLGGMLLSKDAIADVIEVIKGHDFYRPAHETVYQAILDLYAKGEPADPITVAAELTRRGEITRVGGAAYLHSLVQTVPTAANAEYYAEIVHERAVLRRLVEAGTRITQMGYAADGDVDEIVNSAQAEIYAVTEQRTSEDYLPLGDIMEGALDEIEAIGSRSGEMTGVPTGFTDFDSLTNGLHPGQMIVIAARPAMGKALALDTPLPTPTGWTTMGAVQVGEHLIAADGTPTRVVAATDIMIDRPCYQVTFDDGTTVVADADHQWLTDTRASRRSGRKNGQDRWRARATVRTTKEIAATLRCTNLADQRLNHSVENSAPLALPDRELPVPPYTLGAWLADGHSGVGHSGVGHSGVAKITAPDPEIVQRIIQDGFEPRRVGASNTYELSPAVDQPDLLTVLRDMGVLGNKHIPQAYLRGSLTQRRALLAGLLDSGGTVTGSGSVRCALADRALAESLRELVVSLGCRCRMATKRVKGQRVKGRSEESTTVYTVTFTTGDDVFGLGRKRRMHAERRGPGARRPTRRFITDVREIESVPVRCVQVDSAEHLYLATAAMVPTHNSTLALDFARSASIKNDLPSVIFSLEMGRNEIAMRLLSAEARVALHHMRSGTMTDDDWTRLARRMPEVTAAPLYIDDSPNLSMMEIRAKCRRLKQRNDLKLVVIDYLQLMQSGGSRRSESRQQEVSDMSRNLKLLAKELELPVVALSQLNRGPEQRTDKKPMVSDLRESGCLTADTALLRADTGTRITFSEMMEHGYEGLLVWSLDDARRLVPAPVTNVFSSGTKPVYRLRLASARQVKATANHRFLTSDGWTPLGDLDIGSRIAVPRRTPEPLAPGRGWSRQRVALPDGGATNTSNVARPFPEARNLVRSDRIRAGLMDRQFPAGIARNHCGTALYESGASGERMNGCAEALDSESVRGIGNGDVFWDRVVAIEPIGEQPVYDATVKGTHNFIADGVVAHNSIEQDADMVILLHREDAYEKESPRAGEADLIVAKHRNGPTATITVAFQGHYSRFVDMAGA
jgi:replicative DNA helicase